MRRAVRIAEALDVGMLPLSGHREISNSRPMVST